jgi:hypothetical protein
MGRHFIFNIQRGIADESAAERRERDALSGTQVGKLAGSTPLLDWVRRE